MQSVLEQHVQKASRDAPDGIQVSAALCAAKPATTIAVAAVDGERASPSPFRIASLTKPFVAAAIHCLIGQNILCLDDPIGPLLSPDLRDTLVVGGYDVDAIHIRHLLSHTSGVFDHSTEKGFVTAVFAAPQRRWTRRDQVVWAVENGQPYGPAGEYYRYSDTGYILLGDILERAAGLPLGEAVASGLGFADLGLCDARWADETPLDRSARQMSGVIDTSDFHPTFDLFGGGGLIASAAEVATFMRALFTDQILPQGRLLAALATPPAIAHPSTGQPWRTHGTLLSAMQLGRHTIYGQTGHWGSIMLYAPQLDIALTLTLNRDGDAAFAKTLTTAQSILDMIAKT